MKKLLAILFSITLLMPTNGYCAYVPDQPGQATMANSNPVVIASDQSTVPVSAASLPLPSGAATSAKQDTGNTSLASVDTKLSSVATTSKQDTGNTSLASIDGKITAVNTGAVVISSSALPSGAATSAKQDTGNSSLSSLDGKVTAVNTGAVVVASSALPAGAASSAKQPALGSAGISSADVLSVQGVAGMTALDVNVTGGASNTQYTDAAAAVAHPVGTIPVFNNGGTITAVSAANPLPVAATISTAGLATSTKQSDGSQKTQIVDGAGNVIGATSNAMDINIKSGNPTTITATQGTATNLKTQAEAYQGGSAVAAGNPLQVTLANTGANATAVKVDNSAVTQPVSGTFFQATQPISAAAGSIAAGASSFVKLEDVASADADAGVPSMAIRKATPANTSGTDGDYEMLQMSAGRLWTSSTIDAALPAGANVIGHVITDSGSTTVLGSNTGVDIGKLTANQSVNMNQLAGTTTDTNSGNKSAGTLRVVLATDQPALTNKLLVTPDSVALPANQSVNVSQINGVTATMGNGVSGTGVQRVTLASDSTGQVTLATGSNTIGALTANQSVNIAQVNGTTNATNPCNYLAQTTVAISQTASTKLISQASAKKNYICGGTIVAGAAEVVNIVEGTGSTCGTSTAAIAGSTTAANGISLAANGGFIVSQPITGAGTNVDLCLSQSGSSRVAGYITYVQN